MPPSLPEQFLRFTGLKRGLLVLSCIFLDALLLMNGYYAWSIPQGRFRAFDCLLGHRILATLFTLCLIFMLIGLLSTEYSFWITVILVLVPLEFSKPFLSLPAFSPLDYFCFLAIVVILIRRDRVVLWKEVNQVFGVSLWFWLGFFVYVLAAAHFSGGTPRGPFRWIGFLLLYFLNAQQTMLQPSWPKRLCVTLSWLGFGITLLGLYQFETYRSYVQVKGLFNQHNIFSAYLSLCLPAMWIYTKLPSRIPNLVRWGMLCTTTIAFVLSYSRGAWLGLALGSFLLVGPACLRWFNSPARRLGGGLLGVALLVLVVVVIRQPSGRTPWSLSDRQIYMQTGLKIVHEHPWIGLGPGNYAHQISSYLSAEDLPNFKTDSEGKPISFWQHLHNLYLQILVDLGILGFSLWAGGVGILVWRALKTTHQAPSINAILSISLIGFLIHNFVDIVTVNSFDMVFASFLAAVAFSSPIIIKEKQI